MLTLFSSDWTLSDCRHHLSKLQAPRVFKNINRPGFVIPDTDIHVSYTGGDWNEDKLSSIHGRLISSMFYVELEAIPRFYTPSQICDLRICCRISPGPALMDLLVKLRHAQARLEYFGDDPCRTVPIGDRAVFEKCKAGLPFCLRVKVRVRSVESTIQIKLRSGHNAAHDISRCPYKVGELIRDQGLHSVFGRSDHGETTARARGTSLDSDEVGTAIERLQRTIKQITNRPLEE
ncbi:hypothetical protein GGR57DRAFT_268721 [Xylariaceae sp. FL1272]|nr:hypothetical protein GGR57DRAFT_268721 [Xylariaceae sp. FL1272]